MTERKTERERERKKERERERKREKERKRKKKRKSLQERSSSDIFPCSFVLVNLKTPLSGGVPDFNRTDCLKGSLCV